jgi:acetyltransferase-like isoleucine patch superfamily enzyme
MPDVIVSHGDKLQVGDYVYIGNDAKISAHGGVKIGRGTILGPNVTIYSSNHRFKDAESIPFDEVNINRNVEIGENVWIGGNVVIVPGAKIGEGCIIGAGSVVSGTIEDCSIVAGNPCKLIGSRNKEHYFKLKYDDKIFLKIRQENKYNEPKVKKNN